MVVFIDFRDGGGVRLGAADEDFFTGLGAGSFVFSAVDLGVVFFFFLGSAGVLPEDGDFI